MARDSSPNQGSSGVSSASHQSRKSQPPASGRRGLVAPGFGGGTGALAAAAPGELRGHKPTGARGETGRLSPWSSKARTTARIEIGNTTLRHGAKKLVPADFARFSRFQPCPAQAVPSRAALGGGNVHTPEHARQYAPRCACVTPGHLPAAFGLSDREWERPGVGGQGWVGLLTTGALTCGIARALSVIYAH